MASRASLLRRNRTRPPKARPRPEWDKWDPQFHKYQCIVLDYNGEMWPQRVTDGL